MLSRKIVYIGLVTILFSLTSCKQELYKTNNQYNIPEKISGAPLVQFLIEPTNYSATVETQNLAKAFDYSKIANNTLWVRNFNENLKIAPTTRVVTLHETTGLSNIAIDSLLSFVSKGGTLFVTKAIKDERMSFLYGFTPDADWNSNNSASGLNFEKPIFPGMEGYSYDNQTIHKGFDGSNFSNEVNVLVSAFDADYPVLIENKIGNGRVVLYNSSEVLKKEMRGLLFAASLLGLEGIPYPIVNLSTLFLDDFPSPVYDNNEQKIFLENETDKEQLLTSDWWPKMKELANEENIKYTLNITFNSDKNINDDFSFKGWDQSKNTAEKNKNKANYWIMNEYIKDGHEVGFRGYNELPLDNKLWNNPDLMQKAVNASELKWIETISNNLPVSYVAPNNQIDSLGLVALNKGFPSINYIHSSYLGNLDNGGNREFDPDPLNKSFFNYPRLSGGYEISPSERWAMESAFLYTGIWSHTLDTKMLTDSDNPYNAIKSLKKEIVDYKKRHPLTRFLPARLATQTTLDWRYQSFSHLNFEGKYEVSSTTNADEFKPTFWLVYVNNSNYGKLDQLLTDEQIKYETVPLLNGYLYTIKTSTPNLSLPDLRPQIRNLISSTSSQVDKMSQEYEEFNKSKETLTPLKEKIDRLVAEENQEQASELMEELFDNTKYINVDQIETYANSMISTGKEKELWQKLNEIYSTNATSSNAMLSKTVANIHGYPSKEIKKIWLERQMEWENNEPSVLKDYYVNYNTPENKKIIEQVLQTLSNIEPSTENTERYIDFLVDTNSAKLLSTLDAIPPCSVNNENLSAKISYAYSDKLNFKKALTWAKCSNNIGANTIKEWESKSENIIITKDEDFPYYIQYLIVNEPDKAITELEDISPCEAELSELSTSIAFIYAEYAEYEKALAWNECANEIDVKYVMDWTSETRDMEKLKTVYNDYISENPDDYDTMNHMAQLQLLNGNIEEAGKTAMTIPSNKLEPDFKIGFNNEVQNQSDQSKTLYIESFKILMDDAIVKKSEIEKRKKKGSSIGFTSNMWADKFNPTLLNNRFQYGFYNAKDNFHQFSISQAAAYTILSDTLVANDEGRDLLGFEYQYRETANENNPIWASARVEMDNFNKLFFHLNTGIDFLSDKNSTSLALNAHPVRTGPGYVLNIYDLGLKVDQTFVYSQDLKQMFTIDGSYYTDAQYYATGGSRLEYSLIDFGPVRFGSLLEGAYSLGSDEQRDGFPYWLTENRLFGGGGLLLEIGSDTSDFRLKSDFSIFAEQNEPSFQRYEGALSYRIKDFTKINFNYSYFTIDNFFGNTFQLGIQYNFK